MQPRQPQADLWVLTLANKMARMIWAVTTKQENYRMA
jgi:hypothetical protein